MFHTAHVQHMQGTDTHLHVHMYMYMYVDFNVYGMHSSWTTMFTICIKHAMLELSLSMVHIYSVAKYTHTLLYTQVFLCIYLFPILFHTVNDLLHFSSILVSCCGSVSVLASEWVR